MFDPDFDPLAQLNKHEHNIQELIKAITYQSHLLKDLSQQHEDLIRIINSQKKHLHTLTLQIQALKMSGSSPDV